MKQAVSATTKKPLVLETGFVRALFQGRLDSSAILPFPWPDDEARETAAAVIDMVQSWAADAIDPAAIDEEKCIGCNLCTVACHDGAHQCIHPPGTKAIEGHVAPMAEIAAERLAASAGDELYRIPWVDETECVGCNLCNLVCPVEGCITMEEARRAEDKDTWNARVASGRDNVPGSLADL